MKIRTKLLLVLAGITLVPLAMLRFAAHHSSQSLIKDMTERMHQTLLSRAEEDLLRRLRDHVRIVNRDRQIVRLGMDRMAITLHDLVEGEPLPAPVNTTPPIPQDRTPWCRLEPGDQCVPLEVDFSKLSIESGSEAKVRILRRMIPEYLDVAFQNPGLVLWNIVRMESGIATTWPAYQPTAALPLGRAWGQGGLKHHGMMQNKGNGRHLMNPNKTQNSNWIPAPLWYERTRSNTDDTLWTDPFVDPITRKVAVMSVRSIRGERGDFLGATAMVVPMRSILQGSLVSARMTQDMASLLVETVDTEDGPNLHILAEEGTSASGKRSGSWMAHMASTQTEDFSDPNAAVHMSNELKIGRSGTIRMDFEGTDSLWVYAPFRGGRTGLVLVVPMKDVAGEALKAESFVRERIDEQYTLNGYIIALMAAMTLAVALVLSRALTGPITRLALAFRKVAEGKFDTRVDSTGSDEMAELSRTFNSMVPALEDQLQMHESLLMAREIQSNLLPSESPRVPGLDVAGTSIYCDETGGDYFDYLHLGKDNDQLCVVVGDVSGHGIQAALLMTTGRALLRQRAAIGGGLGEIITEANRLLAEDLDKSGRFITLSACAFDPHTGDVRYVRAGHDPSLVYDPNEDRVFELDGPGGLPLGISDEQTYEEDHSTLPPEAFVLLGTDGIWEAQSPQGELFGKARLRELMRRAGGGDASTLLNAILDELRIFVGDRGFKDDVTLVVVKRTKQEPS